MIDEAICDCGNLQELELFFSHMYVFWNQSCGDELADFPYLQCFLIILYYSVMGLNLFQYYCVIS